MTTAIENWAD